MMKAVKAKRAQEAAQKSRENGERVEQIIREADVVEGEVQKTIRRFRQRLKRHRDMVAERASKAAEAANARDGGAGGE